MRPHQRVRFAPRTFLSRYHTSATSLSSSDSSSSSQCAPGPSGLSTPSAPPPSTSSSHPAPAPNSLHYGPSCLSLPSCSYSSASCSSNSLLGGTVSGPTNTHDEELLQLTQSYPPVHQHAGQQQQPALLHHPHHQLPAQPCWQECCDPLGSSLSLFIDSEGVVSHLPTNTKARTNLYRNGSISIVNCEYKLREKYPHILTLIFYMLFYIAFMVLIASMFVMFEKNEEMKIRDQILNTQHQFLKRNPCVDPKSLKTFVAAVLAAADKKVNLAKLNNIIESNLRLRGLDLNITDGNVRTTFKPMVAVTGGDNVRSSSGGGSNSAQKTMTDLVTELRNKAQLANDGIDQTMVGKNRAIEIDTSVSKEQVLMVPSELANWEFSSSLIYVTTVVTTIGYGHVTPITPGGKLLAILAGAVAIPMTLLMFSILISMFRDGPIKLFEIWLIKLSARFNFQTSLMRIRFVHLFLVTVMLFSLLILGPAFFFNWMEPEWTLLDSFYYCFITITTVGLGDYVPGQGDSIEMRAPYQLGIVLYMYISLCMVLLWIALVLRIPYFNFKTFLVIEEPEIEEEHLKLLDEKKRAEAAGHFGYGSTESLVDSYSRQAYHQQQQPHHGYGPVYQQYRDDHFVDNHHQQQQQPQHYLQQQQHYQQSSLGPQQPQHGQGPSGQCLGDRRHPSPPTCSTSRDYR